MTATGTSKVQARRRAREATRRANEARAARDKANIDDAADFLVAVGKIAEIETWKKDRLTQLREQVDAEAAKRMAVQRAKAGAAVARMQDRGETLTTVAARTDIGIGVVRTMLRHAPKGETAVAEDDWHVLGALGEDVGAFGAGGVNGSQPPPEAASA